MMEKIEQLRVIKRWVKYYAKMDMITSIIAPYEVLRLGKVHSQMNHAELK